MRGRLSYQTMFPTSDTFKIYKWYLVLQIGTIKALFGLGQAGLGQSNCDYKATSNPLQLQLPVWTEIDR